jgi:hypothetical protein
LLLQLFRCFLEHDGASELLPQAGDFGPELVARPVLGGAAGGLAARVDGARAGLGLAGEALAAGAALVGQTARSPFSDEELQRRRQQRIGRPLAEILERLSHS